jgi:hypothetical protein
MRVYCVLLIRWQSFYALSDTLALVHSRLLYSGYHLVLRLQTPTSAYLKRVVFDCYNCMN